MAITSAPHNAENYLVGGAIFYYKLTGDTYYRDIGNITNVQVQRMVDTLDHHTSRSGVRRLDRQIVIRQDIQISFNAEELNSIEALKLLFNAGDTSAVTQTLHAAESQTIAAVMDRWIPLTYKKISGVVVSATSDTLVLDTDYALDTDLGMIKFITGGLVSASESVIVTYDAEAITGTEGSQITPMANTGPINMSGGILKIIDNEGNFHNFTFTASGNAATISPTGPLALSDTDWSNVPFQVTILAGATITHQVYQAS